jgi:hypothetical protein
MDVPAAMRQVLVECDVSGARRLWAEYAPHMPQPQNDAEALVCLHRARTEAASIALRLRAYSHRWLVDNGWPSGLPDELRPKAERLYPRIALSVGIGVKSVYPDVAAEIRSAMEDAVLEAEADGRLTDAPFVKGRMMEARAKARKILFG